MNRKPFFAYRSFQKEFDAMREFHAAGVNQFCVFPAHTTNSLGEPYSEYPPTWLAPEVYDFAPFDQQIEDVKKISPNPEIPCMVDLNSQLHGIIDPPRRRKIRPFDPMLHPRLRHHR